MLKKATATAIALSSLTTCAFADSEQGTVTASVLNVRSGPTTNSSVVTKVNKGTVISILSKSGNWYKTKVNGKEGWVSGAYVTINKTSNNSGSIDVNTNAKKAKTTASSLNMRNGAGTSYSIIRK